MISPLRQRPIARRCAPALRMLHASHVRSSVPNTSIPYHAAFSSSPRRSTGEDGTWATCYKIFRKNFYFRIFVFTSFSSIVIYIGSHIETVPNDSGRRRIMLVSEKSIERQAVVRYKLVREKVMEHLVGIEDSGSGGCTLSSSDCLIGRAELQCAE
jgi:hypothetical protein